MSTYVKKVIYKLLIDPFTTENLGTLSTDFMNKKYGKWNVFN